MTMADKIAPYVEQGLNGSQIHALHPEWNYKTIYSAMHRIKTGKWKPGKEKKVEKPVKKPVDRPKGWNKDRKGCRRCQYRGIGHTRNGCNFIIIEGHSRGCKVEDCNVYVKGSVIKRDKLSESKENDVAAGFEVE